MRKRPLCIALILALGAAALAGCYERVVSSRGIGSSMPYERARDEEEGRPRAPMGGGPVPVYRPDR